VSGHRRLRDEAKNGRATIAGEPASEALNWFETPSAMSSAYS
jgi:hypothetical protein